MEGYVRLASIMGAHPEVAILRRFGNLNAENLLYLQAELVNLENELRRIQKLDCESGDEDRSIFGRDWQTLAETSHTPEHRRQWELMLKIRLTLNEYNAALLQQSSIAKLDAPNARDFRFLVDWIKNPRLGNVFLLGADWDVWENPIMEDMVSLKSRQAEDIASRFLTNRLIYWYHNTLGWKLEVHYFILHILEFQC
ncbi:hypothetical protein B0J11DRAFT_587350 [Dendryphion nanum]|uniref:DUF6594 domain-containing protein n=1 Tax=Dendryphion nanum TaxID=256645 RepID=A0A9P9EH88_9PLEO|nr:hypothetical protein B0J11DRAFT_587350 [Dendryphion nanum]